MRATVKFELFGSPHSQETRDFKDKQAGMDMIRDGILAAVIETINDLTVMTKSVPSRWIDMLHTAVSGTCMSYVVNFDDGEIEETVIDVSKETLARFALDHSTEDFRERITDHVRTCVNEQCPVNDFFGDILA